MVKKLKYLLFFLLLFLVISISFLFGVLFLPVFMNPLFNGFDLLRIPDFQEHEWTNMKVEYYTYTTSNSDYSSLRYQAEDKKKTDCGLREIKYFTISDPEQVKNAMKLIRPKDKWPMSVGVSRGTEICDSSGSIWDMSISDGRIYIAKRGTTASFGFDVDNDFAHYIIKLILENERKLRPNAKFDDIGLPYFNNYKNIN